MGLEISGFSPEAIPAFSVLNAQNQVMTQVGTSMLAKTLDVTEQGGQALLDMMRRSMELSVNHGVGANFDVLI